MGSGLRRRRQIAVICSRRRRLDPRVCKCMLESLLRILRASGALRLLHVRREAILSDSLCMHTVVDAKPTSRRCPLSAVSHSYCLDGCSKYHLRPWDGVIRGMSRLLYFKQAR